MEPSGFSIFGYQIVHSSSSLETSICFSSIVFSHLETFSQIVGLRVCDEVHGLFVMKNGCGGRAFPFDEKPKVETRLKETDGL
jgi:hypothetical protein